MRRENKYRGHEIWMILVAIMVAISVCMYSITYLSYNLFAGIVFGLLAALPFGIANRVVHIYD